MKQVKLANELIKTYALKHEDLKVVDLSDQFLINQVPNQDLFVGDGLHMNNDGYDIWRKALTPIIQELLNK